MNILVINGSPKGKDSVTLHTCLYLERKAGSKMSEGMIAPYKKILDL